MIIDGKKKQRLFEMKLKKKFLDIKKRLKNTKLDSNFNWRFCSKSNLREK